MERIFISTSEKDTGDVARACAAITKRGDVWALEGTLGAGKSVFARAFIKASTDATEVPSPTFTLVQAYSSQKGFDIYHYDLYRLKDPTEIFELGVEDAFYEGVSLVEWPEKMGGFTPKNMWFVKIENVPQGRKITICSQDMEKQERLSNV